MEYTQSRIAELEAELASLRAERDEHARIAERLELVLDGAQLGIWDWNVQTNEVFFNRRWKQMLGYEPHELADEFATWQKLLCPEDADDVYRVLGEHLEGKTAVYETEQRLQHKDGHWVWILGIGRIVEWDVSGKPLRATGIHQDISLRKQMASELVVARDRAESANTSKSNFLATMSHEIRTPLTGILGASNLLLESHLDTDQYELGQMVVSSTEGLLDILNDILDLNKIEANKLAVENIPVHLYELLDSTLQLFAQKAEGKGLNLVFDYGFKVPHWVGSDPTRVRQIVLNLLGNAMKFTHNGEVRLKVRLADQEGVQQVLIEVSDTGIGMTEAQLGLVFEQFHQAESSTSRLYGGTGLGTTISKRLAHLLGGDIQVASRFGKGSCFKVFLPLVLVAIPNAKPPLVLKRDYGKIVILAEDNLVNRKVAIRILTTLGIETIVASHGGEVLEYIHQPHDLILMDCQMPIMDGLKTTEMLRGSGYSQPIVALSANAFQEDRQRCLYAGMNDFIMKPFTKASLIQVLDHYLLAG